MRSLPYLCLAAALSAPPLFVEAAQDQSAIFQTAVAPLPDEDLANACRYELTITGTHRPVRGVWVIFDRGRDMLRHYRDPDVAAFAARHGLALLLAFHCPAKDGKDGDMNMNPAKGLGRALFTALEQFATLSRHPELPTAKLILLGFSGTGTLAGRFAEFAPSRVAAVVAAHAGHNPLGLETIALSGEAASIPQLIVAGSTDRITGTERPYAYFRKHFEAGAPWTFVAQNKVPHCCVINAKPLMLTWLDAIVAGGRRRSDGDSYGFIRTAPETVEGCPNLFPPAVPIWCHGTKDAWGAPNWFVTSATFGRRSSPDEGERPAGWLPTRRFAKEWLAFITRKGHPITSLP